MSLITILQTLLIGPLKLIFEIIFVVAERLVGSPGLAIIALSLVINVMMLPLHRRADAIQEASRDKEAKLKPGVDHIKKTFTGDERMMILQTYYRQNDYRPTDALNGSVSLLLEVPFFMAAYQFLSNLAMLDKVAFGPIQNLGAPDGMLVIGGIAINVLPIAMTLINILSGMVYSKGFPLKTKIQMYGLAVVFLVLLYDSPSGLVFYWTLNNLFSLAKNLIVRIPGVKKLGSLLLFVVGIAVGIFGAFFYESISLVRTAFLIGVGIMMMIPMMLQLLQGKITIPVMVKEETPDNKAFLLGGLFLTVLMGMVIPSTYIAASPQEFVDPSYYHNPLLYIVMATCLAAGLFMVWMRVFYWLSTPRVKQIAGRIIVVACAVVIVNYMFFGKNLGMIYPNLVFAETVLRFAEKAPAVNLAVITVVSVLVLLIMRKWERQAISVLLASTIALGGMAAVNMVSIHKEVRPIAEMSLQDEKIIPSFRLSKNGQNVVVIMLDRAIGQLVPYIFNEKPELQEKFDGFVHYENTISYGTFTVFGSPGLVGGYEYTPVEMNKRSDEMLVDKHNEALKVMPVLFSENGYETTVMDPVYANYQWVPDLSIYDEYPDIDTYLTNGVFVDGAQRQAEIDTNYRNFFCLSLMKSAPVILQKSLYSKGTYNRAPLPDDLYAGQIDEGISRARGFRTTTMDEYAILDNMDTMTQITDEKVNTYMFIDNNLTHEQMLLQAPEYVPAEQVDNTSYDAEHADRFSVNGRKLNVTNAYQMSHYHVNMAAMLKLGEWFDYLRENDVYDNTRIIIVSDHGRGLQISEELMHDLGYEEPYDVTNVNALLMVKDFGSTGFSTSDAFMTNADVPTLSVEGLIENPINPFTGKLISNSEKYAHDQLIIRSEDWGVTRNASNTFRASKWSTVKGNLWERDNWTFLETEEVLTEHKLP